MAKKPMSHFERMTKKVEYTGCAGYARPYEEIGDEQVVDNGRVLKQTKVVSVSPIEKFKNVKATDFALENVIAAGAVDLLKPVILHDGDIDTVDMFDGELNSIMDQIDAQAAQAQAQVDTEAPKNNDGE